MKKYNYKEFRKDPRTYSPTKELPRYIKVLFDFIDNNKDLHTLQLFSAIDEAYTVGQHRSPSYIKKQKILAIKLLNTFEF